MAAAALLVTLVTWIALGDDYVRFGILHCIAVAMVVGPLLLPLGPVNLILAWASCSRGWRCCAARVRHPRPAGVRRPARGRRGCRWYPLLPWLAPVLAGLVVGQALYQAASAGRGAGACRPRPGPARWGRRAGALPIYLVHQPVLMPLVLAALAIAGVEVSLDEFR